MNKEIIMMVVLIIATIAIIPIAKDLLEYTDKMEECNTKGGVGYSYINNDGECCITSASGWYDTEEGTVTNFIFGSKKRWREFTCT